MSKVTGRPGSPAGESVLDRRLCTEIGAALGRVREERGLSLSEVGEKLLLSTRQVKALEEVDFAAFHNATFQLNALKKYAQFAELDPALISKLSAALVTSEPEASTSRHDAPFVSAASDEPGRWLRAALSVLVVAALVGSGLYLLRARSVAGPSAGVVVAAQVPAAVPAAARDRELPPSPEAKVADGDVVAAASADPIIAKTPAAFGTLRVARQTWIFVRDADSVGVERSLADGELFELETQPTYLAIGTTDAELTIGNARVDVTPFIANGQIRIRAGDFDALVQGASPIQAPTAVAPGR